MRSTARFLALTAMVVLGLGGLTGCVYHDRERVSTTPPPTSTIVVQPTAPQTVTPVQREYTYPEGKYVLQGSGTTSDPYYWVWIPNGVQTVPPVPRLSMIP